jgi:iron complex outermembrane recepter protein
MKRHGIVLLTMMIFVALLSPGALLAEDFEPYTLGEIEVTAEKLSSVKEMAISTEVTPEDFSATSSRTITEAMQYVPGVQVTTGRKMEPNISIHGFSQDKVLILIDGVPYYESKYGKLDMNQVSTDSVARIDVIKGAASVLYGANAEAGVINIITKKASDKPSFSGNIEIGENSAAALSLSHGMKKGNLSYWVSYMHRDWDSWKLSDDFEPRVGVVQTGSGRNAQRVNTVIEDGGDRNNSDYKTDNVYVKVGLEPSADSEYFLNMHYTATEKGDPPNIDRVQVFPSRPAFSQFDRIEKYDDWGADLSGRKKLTDKFGLLGKLYYHNHVDDYVSYSDETFDTAIASSRYQDYLLGGMIIGDYSIADWNTMKFDINYRLDNHEQRDDEYLPFEKSSSYTGSIGLEDEVAMLDSRLSLVGGIGYDWFDVKESEGNTTDRSTGDFTGQVEKAVPDKMTEINPMIGANYNLSDATKIFASIARKTRFPTLNQLYTSKGGNVDLKAEKSINYTIGISRAFGKIASVEFSPFYHDISDRISRDLPDPDPANLYHNSAAIKMYGLEFNADVNPLENLSFKLGYTYNNAEDVSPGQVTEEVTGVPDYIVNARVQYALPNLGSRLDLTMVSYGNSYRQLPTAMNPTLEVIENDSYTVFGAKITQPFLEKWEAYLTVNNLLDEDYEPESGYPGQGRAYYLGVSFNY